MWTHPATRANVARLREPSATRSCRRTTGRSRPASPASAGWPRPPAIVDAVVAAVAGSPGPGRRSRRLDRRSSGPARDADLEGRHVVVTAGGTREAIDPVRFIGNRSTGKMGVAIAEAALDRGARVTLVAANVEVAATRRGDGRPGRVDGRPARRAPAAHPRPDGAAGFDALVMAAAVADFRPAAHAGSQARARRRHDPGARAHAGPARRDRPDRARPRQRGRRDPRPAPAAPGPRRVRRRDRLARAGRREAPAQGRGPAGRQRRRRSRAPGSGPTRTGSRSSPPTVRARSCRSCPSATSPTGSWIGSPPALDARDAAAQTSDSPAHSLEPA